MGTDKRKFGGLLYLGGKEGTYLSTKRKLHVQEMTDGVHLTFLSWQGPAKPLTHPLTISGSCCCH